MTKAQLWFFNHLTWEETQDVISRMTTSQIVELMDDVINKVTCPCRTGKKPDRMIIDALHERANIIDVELA